MTTTARMTIYPTHELKQQIEEIAARERRSVNAQVLTLLEQAVRLEGVPFPIESYAPIESRAASEPVKVRVRRTGTCEHRISADRFCKVCDA